MPSSMLRQRILTALVLMPPVVAGVLLLPTVWVGAVLALVLLLGAQEWVRLAGIRTAVGRFAFLSAYALGVLGLGGGLVWHLPVLPVVACGALWWLAATWQLGRIRSVVPQLGADPTAMVLGVLILVTTWGGLVWLHLQPRGPQLMLFLLSLIWVADSGAYFAGRRWGRVKLAPLVSPGKTREGVYGALAGATIWGSGLAWLLGGGIGHAAGLVILSLVTVAASMVGDLYESLLKRRRGLKDSGALLPGHGGMLDRIDSLTAAAPIFAVGLALLGHLR
jgi:phosphatidate cytidylyltransferase